MKVDEFIKSWDSMFEERDIEKVKAFLSDSILSARKDNDDASLLTIYNEAMGYFREHSIKEEAYYYAAMAIDKAEGMNLKTHPAFATTLSNAANVYRAFGDLSQSLECYEKVKESYKNTIDDSDMLYAGMYNNMALLKQEMGQFKEAKELLLKALEITDENDNTVFEKATTYANLSSTAAALDELDESLDYGKKSIDLFREIKVADSHYAAALNGLGSTYYKKGNYEKAVEYLDEAAGCILKIFGKTQSYKRVRDNARAARQAINNIKGLDLCREYYSTYGKPMLEEKFGKYLGGITVGLCGEGSDCSGFDDVYSRDHDWGPGFSIFIDEDLYDAIGDKLIKAYEELPDEFRGFRRRDTVHGSLRTGVCLSEDYYERILGRDWQENIINVPEEALFTAVSGEIFHSADTKFEYYRNELKNHFPSCIRLAQMAQSAALFSQGAQYNYPRMLKRGDIVAARISLSSGINNAMKLIYESEGMFAPCDKWLYKGLNTLPDVGEEKMLIWKIMGLNTSPDTEDMLLSIERLALLLAERLYVKGYISNNDSYLDMHTDELVVLSSFAKLSHEELVERIAEEEFEAFDKVKNEGGRADCQDNWPIFRIMRISQYDVWTDEMLIRYLYDFKKNLSIGRNIVAEKYARMMESTAPQEYERLKKDLPEMTNEQRALIDSICAIQVGMMEEFTQNYPEILQRSRSIRTVEDNLYNTSYETYLRGELSTYSSALLIMYGRLIVNMQASNKNIAELIIRNTLDMYGYEDISDNNTCPLRRRNKE